MPSSPIAVLGEALVDEFHDGPVAGGAPFNVLRSAAGLGVPAHFVSRTLAPQPWRTALHAPPTAS